MAYEKEEFKKMRFPVFFYENQLFRYIPELMLHKEFLDLYGLQNSQRADSITFDKAFKYLAFLHDMNSPILKHESDVRKRKVEAAKLAGISMKDGQPEQKYLELMQNTGKYKNVFNRAIVRYCRLQNEQDFFDLCIYDQKKIENSTLLLNTQDFKEQKDLLTNNKMLSDMIKDSIAKLLNDDNKSLESELLEEISNYNLELTPEQLILNRQARDRVMQQGNPYKEYKKELHRVEELNDDEYEQLLNDMCNDTPEARKHFEAIGLQTEGEISIQKNREKVKETMKKVNARRDSNKWKIKTSI